MLNTCMFGLIIILLADTSQVNCFILKKYLLLRYLLGYAYMWTEGKILSNTQIASSNYYLYL